MGDSAINANAADETAGGGESGVKLPGARDSARRDPGGLRKFSRGRTAPMAVLARMAQLDAAIEPTIFHQPVEYSLADIARISGTTVQHVFDLTRWIGSTPRDATAVDYTELDLIAVQSAMEFSKAEGLDDAAMGTLLRGMGFLMERLTTRQVTEIIQQNKTSFGLGDSEARLLAAEQAPRQAEMMLQMLAHVYRRHLAISTRRLTVEAITQRGLLSSDAEFPLVRAIGFADIVNFTARTAKATPQEFTALVQDFREGAWDIINNGRGRTINYIGDAVFFVADTIEEGADIALSLAAQDAFDAAGPLRVGLAWSRLVAIFGDAYGPGVNLASRLCDASDPAEVYIDSAAARLLSALPEYEVVARPEFDAHGIGVVHPFRLRHSGDPRSIDQLAESDG